MRWSSWDGPGVGRVGCGPRVGKWGESSGALLAFVGLPSALPAPFPRSVRLALSAASALSVLSVHHSTTALPRHSSRRHARYLRLRVICPQSVPAAPPSHPRARRVICARRLCHPSHLHHLPCPRRTARHPARRVRRALAPQRLLLNRSVAGFPTTCVSAPRGLVELPLVDTQRVWACCCACFLRHSVMGFLACSATRSGVRHLGSPVRVSPSCRLASSGV